MKVPSPGSDPHANRSVAAFPVMLQPWAVLCGAVADLRGRWLSTSTSKHRPERRPQGDSTRRARVSQRRMPEKASIFRKHQRSRGCRFGLRSNISSFGRSRLVNSTHAAIGKHAHECAYSPMATINLHLTLQVSIRSDTKTSKPNLLSKE
ncbi:hypothetical protein BC834DRAFT_97869 [Gloeopeniophorella convolvens]|nr:hypothetical protein BC834DRAFT_97869 [Gloeopeniophorella convolvens]